LNNNSTEIQATGLIFVFLSALVLFASPMRDVIHNITKVEVDTIFSLSVVGFFLGIAIFIIGLKSGKSSS
jgi:hypothetical protein